MKARTARFDYSGVSKLREASIYFCSKEDYDLAALFFDEQHRFERVGLVPSRLEVVVKAIPYWTEQEAEQQLWSEVQAVLESAGDFKLERMEKSWKPAGATREKALGGQ